MINKKNLSILGAFLLIVGIIGALFTYNAAHEKESISEKKVIEDKSFESIDIQTDNATVEIISTEDDISKVELTGKQSKSSKNKFTVDVVNGELTIKLKDQHWKFFSFDFFSPSLLLKVYVPEKQYNSLKISSDNGKINMDHLNAKEIHVSSSNGQLEMNDLSGLKLVGEVDNGEINAENLQIDDEVNIKSNNGTIELKHVAASLINTETDNGKIMLDQVDGEIVGKTNNGRILLSINDLDRPIKLKSDNGSIKIVAEKEPVNARFEVKVDNGKINLFDKYDGSAVIGNGDNLIKLTTNNGEITVTK